MKRNCDATPVLMQAPIYNFVLALAFGHNEAFRRYSGQYWFKWGWCRLDEVLELVNKHHGMQWSKTELLQRFAISAHLGQIKGSNSASKRWGLYLLTQWGVNLCCEKYNEGKNPSLEERNFIFYVPSGWVKEVLWALQSGFTRSQLLEGNQVACLEDGTPYMIM